MRNHKKDYTSAKLEVIYGIECVDVIAASATPTSDAGAGQGEAGGGGAPDLDKLLGG